MLPGCGRTAAVLRKPYFEAEKVGKETLPKNMQAKANFKFSPNEAELTAGIICR